MGVQRLGEASESRDDPLLVGGEPPTRRAGLCAGTGEPPADRRGLTVDERHTALGALHVVGDHAVGGLVVVAVGLPVRRQHDPVLDRRGPDLQRSPDLALTRRNTHRHGRHASGPAPRRFRPTPGGLRCPSRTECGPVAALAGGANRRMGQCGRSCRMNTNIPGVLHQGPEVLDVTRKHGSAWLCNRHHQSVDCRSAGCLRAQNAGAPSHRLRDLLHDGARLEKPVHCCVGALTTRERLGKDDRRNQRRPDSIAFEDPDQRGRPRSRLRQSAESARVEQ